MRYDNVKRAFDVVAAGTGLVALSPVLAAVGVAVWLDVGRPVVFRQQRAGRGGAPFSILKFRTMRDAVGPDGEPLPDGDRLTSVGDFLRHSSLDELPQLWNVLRGEMSVVGPRPEMPFIVDAYGPMERERLSVKPGITGLWQISYFRRGAIHENLEYDLFYIENKSLLLDLVIISLTGFAIMKGTGAY